MNGKNKVTNEDVSDVLDNAEIICSKLFDNCTMVACRLDNGFVIVESSACVDPSNYSDEVGYKLCMQKIIDKIYELEGFKLCEQRIESERYNGELEEDEYLDCESCSDLDKCLEEYDRCISYDYYDGIYDYM